jgi:hypothetical protein
VITAPSARPTPAGWSAATPRFALGLRPAWGVLKRYGGIIDGNVWLRPRLGANLALAGGLQPDAGLAGTAIDFSAVLLRGGLSLALYADGVAALALRADVTVGRYAVSGSADDRAISHQGWLWGFTTSLVESMSLGRIAIVACADLDVFPARDRLLVDGAAQLTTGFFDLQLSLGAEVRW